MPLGGIWAEAWKKACSQTKKALESNYGKGTQPQKRPHHTHLAGPKMSSNELGYPHTEVGRPLAVLCAKADKMFMRTVQQNMFLILNSVPVTFVTDPELIRLSIPVMTNSLNQEVTAEKAKARKCTAEIAGNIQARVERQHRLMIPTSVIQPARNNPRSTPKWVL